jgi:hypothetical protein
MIWERKMEGSGYVQYKAKSRYLNEKTTKHFNEDSRSVNLDFNLRPLVHEASVRTIRLRKSIKIYIQRTTTSADTSAT